MEPFEGDLSREVQGLFINGRGELAAWGFEEGGMERRALLWTSIDGANWRTEHFDPSLEDSLVTDLASGPLGFVAVGWNSLTRAAWHSGDGVVWQRAVTDPPALPEDGSFAAVAAGAQGFLAVGGSDDGALAWFSPTGDNWTSLGAQLPFGYFADVTRSPDGGFVAVGVDQSDGDWDAAVWHVSEDGRQWTEITSGALATGDDDALYEIDLIAGQYLAFGQITPRNRRNCPDCDVNPEYWRAYTSVDGSSWERSLLAGDPEGAAVPLPLTSPTEQWGNGIVAIGQGDDRQRHVWSSADGVRWLTAGDALALPVPNGEFLGVRDVLAAEGYLVIGGTLGRSGYVATAKAEP